MSKLTIISKMFLILNTITISCTKQTKDYLGTRILNDSLFVEIYTNNDGGVFASSYNYYYLTDSTKFYKYMGAIDDDQGVRFGEYLGGVYFNKYTDRKKSKLIDSSFYKVSILKAERTADRK